MKYRKEKRSKYKIFAILYSLIVMFSVYQAGNMIFNVVSAVDEWDTTVKPVNGISIVENSSSRVTMLVSTPAAFDYALYYASNPASTVDLTIELIQSIDMSAKYIKPKNITNTKLTKLTIKGRGNTISGLKYSTAIGNYMGIISYITRPLLVESLNLRVSSTKITTNANAFGALIGVTEGNNDDITITRCTIHGRIECTNIQYEIGGLIGCTGNSVKMNNCWSYCTIVASPSNHSAVGGLAGSFRSESTVTNCANFEGEIKSTSSSSVGGLFGYIPQLTVVSKCFNNARVESNWGPVGGLIGNLDIANVTINDCYNNADLSCGNGLAVGGIIGQTSSGHTFNRCYSNGKLERHYTQEQEWEYDNEWVEISQYALMNTSDPNTTDWRISYNSSFDIQNNGGDDNGGNNGGGNNNGGGSSSYQDMKIGIQEKGRVKSPSYKCANLVGWGDSTYNNCFCHNSFDDYNNYNDIELMHIHFYLSCGSNIHDVGFLQYYASKKFDSDGNLGYPYTLDDYYTKNYDDALYCQIYNLNNYYLFEFDLYDRYGFRSTTNFDVYEQICNLSGCEYITDFQLIRIYGLTIIVDKEYTQVTIKPCYYYKTRAGIYGYVTDDNIEYTVSLPELPNKTNNSSLVSSASDINLSTLGSAFATASGINGGLPILKDFYWEYDG